MSFFDGVYMVKWDGIRDASQKLNKNTLYNQICGLNYYSMT